MVRKTKAQPADGLTEDNVKEEGALTEEQLLERLQEAEKRVEENYDRYLRLLAEFDNYKKRTAREKAETAKFCNEDIIRDLVPLIDNLDRAISQACNADDFKSFRDGLDLVKQQTLACLKKHGIEEIEAVGKDFDPNFHEALYQVEGEDLDNKIVAELEKGYLLHGRLLKAARVSVGRRKQHK